MIRLKKRYWFLVTVLLSIALLLVITWRYWTSFKQQYGIAVDWQGASISFNGLCFDELTLTKQTAFSLTGKKVTLSWSNLSADEFSIYLSANEINSGLISEILTASLDDKEPTPSQSTTDSSSLPTLLYWLPNTIDVKSFKLYSNHNQVIDLNIDVKKDYKSIQLTAKTNTILEATLLATLTLNNIEDKIDIQNGLLTAKLNNNEIINADLSIPFSGWINTEKLSLQSQEKALIYAEKLIFSPDFSLMDVSLDLQKSQISIVNLTESPLLNTEGLFTLTTKSIASSYFNPINWQSHGKFTANLDAIHLDGELDNEAGLKAQINIDIMLAQLVSIKGTIPKISFSVVNDEIDNPLAKTFSIWPQLLDLTNGEINVELESQIPLDDKPIKLSTKVNMINLDGIYNRTEIKSIAGASNITISDDKLKVAASSIIVKSIEHGITFNDAQLTGQYIAPIDNIAKGVISWHKAIATFFSGTIFIENGQFNLAKPEQKITVKLQRVQLKNIFDTYPVEGLDGDGEIEGTLPIQISINRKNDMITFVPSMKNGQLMTTRSGFLKFNSLDLKNYAKKNTSMQIVADVLSNFHYTKLTGNVDYKNEIAKLALNIQGKNPDVQEGNPVNLNVTIEENMTKLMMSLQLADEISDPIRKRIEQRLKQQ